MCVQLQPQALTKVEQVRLLENGCSAVLPEWGMDLSCTCCNDAAAMQIYVDLSLPRSNLPQLLSEASVCCRT